VKKVDAVASGTSRPVPVLHVDGGLNANVVRAEYAVRGRIYQEAAARSAAGKEVILTNTGNPQALGQKPITFMRQVLALVNYPELLQQPEAKSLFPADVLQRAQTYVDNIPGGTGAYQDSRGNAYIRQEVADFITARDGHPADAESVFLSDGAGPAIQHCLRMVIRDENDGILLSIPQYPLYSAAIQVFGGRIVGYELDEEHNWSLNVAELDRRVADARAQGVAVRAMVIINPGNPTGQVLSYDNMRELVLWARRERVVLMADEVYQVNVFGSRPFTSFKKVVCDLGEKARDVELFSFHTVSKGVTGECGHRGGYVEATNVDADVMGQLYKLFSMNLSSNVDGQVLMGLMVNPPKEGDPSYPQYLEETQGIFQAHRRRAQRLHEAFNKLQGVSCRAVEVSAGV
jgi:aspartate/methionine/tyrosine aminotransferase